MTDVTNALMDNVVNTANRRKLVQIAIQFTCDNDDEAMAVKKAVSSSLSGYPEVQVTFTLAERPTSQNGRTMF